MKKFFFQLANVPETLKKNKSSTALKFPTIIFLVSYEQNIIRI